MQRCDAMRARRRGIRDESGGVGAGRGLDALARMCHRKRAFAGVEEV